ncbi:asparagine synthase C-terminal domain-containing protein [Planctomycetota bacterium]
MIDLDFCISSYLTFRYVARKDVGWKEGFTPEFPELGDEDQHSVSDAREVLEKLEEIIAEKCPTDRIGMLMSGGIDSAIIAALMPKNTQLFTVNFVAPNAVDEGAPARVYAEKLGLQHHVVEVTWEDYLDCIDSLMVRKKSPLHPAEAGIFQAASAAKASGVDTLTVGNGADSTFGGMDKLLSRDWSFDEFVERYTFLKPELIVEKPVSMLEIYKEYRANGGVNVQGFLKILHGLGIVQMFDNAIEARGLWSASSSRRSSSWHSWPTYSLSESDFLTRY